MELAPRTRARRLVAAAAAAVVAVLAVVVWNDQRGDDDCFSVTHTDVAAGSPAVEPAWHDC